MAYYVNTERAMQPNLLLLDVGDAPYNTNVANLFEGEPVIKIMNMMGYDAMAIGIRLRLPFKRDGEKQQTR